MNLRFISTKVHGYLDYATAALLPVLSRAVGCGRRSSRLHDAVAGGTAGLSLMTDYEVGLVKLVPMETHLTIDVANGAMLVMASMLMDEERRGTRLMTMGAGLFYLMSGLCTQKMTPKQVVDRDVQRRKRAVPEGESPMQRYARERNPEWAQPAAVGNWPEKSARMVF